MTFAEAKEELYKTTPARRKRDRYQQRDELQRRLIPLLPDKDRDKVERAMNQHFRL